MQAVRTFRDLDWTKFFTISLTLCTGLVIGWIIPAAFAGTLPILGNKSTQFLFLFLPSFFVVLIFLSRGDLGAGLVVLLSTALIGKTGMQLDIGPLRTSALEGLILVAAVLLAVRTRLFSTAPQWPRLVIDRPLVLFGLLGLPAVIMALLSQVSWVNIVWELKSYFLYPCFAYLMVAWISSVTRLKAVVIVGMIVAIIVAATGIVSFRTLGIQADAALEEMRVSGSFGTINQYGFYMASMALLGMGINMSQQRRFLSALGILPTLFLVAAMALTGSRGVWLGFACGIGVLFLNRRFNWLPLILVGLGVIGVWVWQLPYFGSRMLTLADGSTLTRVDYLGTGWAVFQKYPLFGAGWGAGFWMSPSGQLYQVASLPQLHNDYLNLLTQVGIVGFLPFLAIWLMVIRAALSSVRRPASAMLTGLVTSALAGLIALLIQAATDHVFWRPDIAGQIWWITGILLAGVRLADSSEVRNE